MSVLVATSNISNITSPPYDWFLRTSLPRMKPSSRSCLHKWYFANSTSHFRIGVLFLGIMCLFEGQNGPCFNSYGMCMSLIVCDLCVFEIVEFLVKWLGRARNLPTVVCSVFVASTPPQTIHNTPRMIEELSCLAACSRYW